MAVLPIHVYGSGVLRKKTKPVGVVDNSVIELIHDMFDTLKRADGVGLAANQVGSSLSLAVIDLSGAEDYEGTKPIVMLNPEILRSSGESVSAEGCLSIPGVRAEVSRAETVTVRYQDTDFIEHELSCTSLAARAVQHEIDHLNGILFVDRLDAEQSKVLRVMLEEISSGEIEAKYPVTQATRQARR
jgi:peptide deformylase